MAPKRFYLVKREAFKRLGGTVRQREPRRNELTHVPGPVRNRDRLIGMGDPVLPRYKRIAFEKHLIAPQGQPLAAFVCPGHALLDATLDLTLERHRDLLRRGSVLVDESGRSRKEALAARLYGLVIRGGSAPAASSITAALCSKRRCFSRNNSYLFFDCSD
jgi:hypothetical protein